MNRKNLSNVMKSRDSLLKTFFFAILFFCILFSSAIPLYASTEPSALTNYIILVGDIGGTNARLELLEVAKDDHDNITMKVIAKKAYKSNEHEDFLHILSAFSIEFDYDFSKIGGVCFAVAGPIIGNEKVKFTDLPWSITLSELKKFTGIDKVFLLNDFEAIGHSLESLAKDDLYILQKGRKQKQGLKVIIGAGTGLGVGFSSWNGSQYIVHPSEGGHAVFAPNDDTQLEVWKYMQEKYDHVPIGYLLSGRGLVDIYSYFSSSNSFKDEIDEKLKLAMEHEGKAYLITEFADKHKTPLALQTIDTFVRIYGAKASDIAYTFLPRGGLYIAGGIAPKILNYFLKDSTFMSAFNKGRLPNILNDIPVYIILNTDVGLMGAAAYIAKKLLDSKLQLNIDTNNHLSSEQCSEF